jgi:GT2 family glycosyltransferase
MQEAARQYTCRHAGELYPLKTTIFFCVMFSRGVFDAVGPLCEEYEMGCFEDDDYCRRAERLGYTMACAEDAFVHHECSATFNAIPALERLRIFEKNRAVYEKKWGRWIPHSYRLLRKPDRNT